jgi:hypothetical protein
MVGEQHGNGMGTAWERHGMCESALRGQKTYAIVTRSIASHTVLPTSVDEKTTGVDVGFARSV